MEEIVGLDGFLNAFSVLHDESESEIFLVDDRSHKVIRELDGDIG